MKPQTSTRPPPTQKKPQPQEPEKRRAPLDTSNMHDIVFRAGLDEELIRIKKKDFDLLLDVWMLAGEDIILRATFNNFERNIVLRGNSNGVLDIKSADPARKIPLYSVIRAKEMYGHRFRKAKQPEPKT